MQFNLKAPIDWIKAWFPKARATFEEHAFELESNLSDSQFAPLPESMQARLSKGIDALVSAPKHREAVRSELAGAIAQWTKNPTAPNHLVVLASPVEPIAQIITETLATYELPDEWQVQSLPWRTRPQDPATIWAQLISEIGGLPMQYEAHPILTTIPDLSWCFLRCADGLDAIDALLDWIGKDSSRFWLIGCNDWAWLYLERVCQLSAYLESTLSLPTLSGKELKTWLHPLSETINVELKFEFKLDKPEQSTQQPNDNQDNWSSSAEQRYFEHLADLSTGLSAVAAQLWMRSFHAKAPADPPDSSAPAHEQITLKPAMLPDLPSFVKDDRYLLYSLCLHGKITLSALALSLGESPRTIQASVRLLQRAGIVESGEELLWVNPVHYPRLRRDLGNNQFLVGEVD